MVRRTVQLPGLAPNAKYAVQVRGVSADDHPGTWSTALSFDVAVDTVAPGPVTDASASVVGSDFVVRFTKPTVSADGTPLDDLRDVIIRFYPTGTPGDYHEVTTVDTEVILPFSTNRSLFDDPEPAITFELRARDRVGNESTPVVVSASNPAPGAATLTAQAKRLSVDLFWTLPSDTDLARVDILRDNTVIASTSPSSTNYTDADPAGTAPYVVRVYDVFGQSTDSNAVTEGPVDLDFESDTIAPNPPTNLLYSDEAVVDRAIATLTWDAPTTDTDASTYTDQEGFRVRYRTDPARAFKYTEVPDTRADGSVTATFSAEVEVEAGETLEWGVAAVDRSLNTSTYATASSPTSVDSTAPQQPATPSVAGSTHTIQVSHNLTDSVGNPLRDTVTALRIYIGTTETFGSMTMEQEVAVGKPSNGLSMVTSIPYYVSRENPSRFVRVVAVTATGIESVPSAATPVTLDLIDNLNVGLATLTNAEINDLDASKLNAGTAFINDLSIESVLTVNEGGLIKSPNYDFATRTGWAVDDGNLYLFDGEIDASLITIQQGANVVDHAYAVFTNDPAWYATNIAVNNATGMVASVTSIWSRYGPTSLRMENTSGAARYVYLAPDTSTFNTTVEESVSYIMSVYVHNNGVSAASIQLAYRHSGSLNSILIGPVTSIPAGTTQRLSAVFTVPAGQSKISPTFYLPGNADLMLDGLQIERQVASNTDPSFFKVGGLTTLGGGQITTGALRSNVLVGGLPAWELDLAGDFTARSGTFSGALDAATGTFSGDLSAAGGTFSGALSGGTIAIGTDAFNVDASGNMWMGAADFASAPFSVTAAGGMKASGADIAGTITATGGTVTGNLVVDSGQLSFPVSQGTTSERDLRITSSELAFYKYWALHDIVDQFASIRATIDGNLTIDASIGQAGNLILWGDNIVAEAMGSIEMKPDFDVIVNPVGRFTVTSTNLTLSAAGYFSPAERFFYNNASVSLSDGTARTVIHPGNFMIMKRDNNNAMYLARGGDAGAVLTFLFGSSMVYKGDIAITGTGIAVNGTSDYRLKKDVVDLDAKESLARVMGSRPRKGRFRDNDAEFYGYIAHELQQHFPWAVRGEKDEVDDEGNPVYQGIDPSKLIPDLHVVSQHTVIELREAKSKIADLEERLARLEALLQ